MINSQRIVIAGRSSQSSEKFGVAISGEKGRRPGPGKIPTTGLTIYNNVVEVEASAQQVVGKRAA